MFFCYKMATAHCKVINVFFITFIKFIYRESGEDDQPFFSDPKTQI